MSSLSPTTPSNTLPPLLRLASELHLAIISYLPDFQDAFYEHDVALLQLRRTNKYFRDLVPPPTHDDLLHLEWALSKHAVYACRFCLRLRPAAKFASTMLKGKTGINGIAREKRFCADCGFNTAVFGKSQRYCPGTRTSVGGVDWVWCKQCRLVKKGEEAYSVCVGLCKACYNTLGCRCGLKCKRPPPRSTLPEARSKWFGIIPCDRDDGTDEYDYWEEQMSLVQEDDDDWRHCVDF